MIDFDRSDALASSSTSSTEQAVSLNSGHGPSITSPDQVKSHWTRNRLKMSFASDLNERERKWRS